MMLRRARGAAARRRSARQRREVGDEVARALARGLRRQLVGLVEHRARRCSSGMPARARVRRGCSWTRLVAEAALGHVDDALEGEVVGRAGR